MRPVYSTLPLLSAFIVLFCSSVGWPGSGCAIKPSFDCSRASHAAEELVCADNELAELDNLLAQTYQTALTNFPADEKQTLRAMQRGWIKGRNDCWKDEDLHGCVTFAYRSRITELQIRGGTVTVPEPVTYKCYSGDHDYLTAVYYTKTAMPAVVLTGSTGRDFWQETVLIIPSGSWGKYRGRNILFWSKGPEAMVERQGKQINCIEMNNRS